MLIKRVPTSLVVPHLRDDFIESMLRFDSYSRIVTYVSDVSEDFQVQLRRSPFKRSMSQKSNDVDYASVLFGRFCRDLFPFVEAHVRVLGKEGGGKVSKKCVLQFWRSVGDFEGRRDL